MPNAYPPPVLSRWSLAWRYGLAIIGYVGALVVPLIFSPNPDWYRYGLTAALGLVGLVLIGYRRRYPTAVASILALFQIGTDSLGVVATWALISAATHRRWRSIAVVSAVNLVAMVGTLGIASGGTVLGIGASRTPANPGEVAVMLIMGTLMIAACVSAGMYIGARRDWEASLRDRAETAEREQELHVRQGQADERNRIAREMHDVLAHRLSLISMHAGVLAYRDNLTPEQTRQVAATIQENAHASLEELRGVLGSLRSTDAAPEKPQPNLPQIPALIAEATEAGARVDYSSGIADASEVPPAIGRHAYRIVQEGLTNARKHAPHARISVALAGGPGEGLTVTVRNPTNGLGGTVPGAGVGLLGLAERAAITGGRISHGVGADGVFDLTVWLPW